MRTSLTEIETIDSFLMGTMAGGDQLILRARMLLDKSFRSKVAAQKAVMRLSVLHARQKLKAEITEYAERFLAHPERRSLREELNELFKADK